MKMKSLKALMGVVENYSELKLSQNLYIYLMN